MAAQEPTRRLGRGLDALLARREEAPAESLSQDSKSRAKSSSAVSTPSSSTSSSSRTSSTSDTGQDTGSRLQTLKLAAIAPNPYQPRKFFKSEELADLKLSLEANGLLQPITVRPVDNGVEKGASRYELIAGERRLRAADELGWTEIPAIVRPTTDRAALTLAMVENLQRSDLDAMEEADGYHRLMEEFALSQQDVADVVGKSRSAVANAVRLRQLPAEVQTLLRNGTITAGHARALLGLDKPESMISLAKQISSLNLSVRDVERRVQTGQIDTPRPAGKMVAKSVEQSDKHTSAESRRIQELLRKKLQTGVTINLTSADQGDIRISFFSNEDLERLLSILGVNLEF